MSVKAHQARDCKTFGVTPDHGTVGAGLALTFAAAILVATGVFSTGWDLLGAR
ncbi:hypothetical protein [Streptomyces sp. NPDC007883]|uniref:hypothetical protein n=1 Tax=Streptomyces sp. NPDC007883 TaxID=3155116 RepID=UPI0033C9A039